MERVAAAISAWDAETGVLSEYRPEGWRRAMADGELSRTWARLRSLVFFPLRVAFEARARRLRAIVATTNPFILPAILVALRPLHGSRVVSLVYDLYPDAFEVDGAIASRSALGRVLEGINRYWLARADGVVFIGKRMADHVKSRYTEPKRYRVIETGANASEFLGGNPPPAAIELAQWCGERKIVSYVGNLGRMHDWRTLAEAGPRFLAKHLDAAFVIASSGPGADALKKEWADIPADRVRFTAPLTDDVWAWLLSRSSVSVVTLKREAAHTSIPSKAFSAMASKCAIVAIAPRESDLGDVVALEECGYLVPPGHVDECVKALGKLVSDPSDLLRCQNNAFSAVCERYDIELLSHEWIRFLQEIEAEPVRDGAYELLKRVFDVSLSAIVLAAASPIMATASLSIAATMGRPVFFRQKRPGKAGKSFELVKFRTMRNAGPGEQGPDADGARLTRIGRLFRATSIDELPSLWNVLEGSMSIVGPRPLLMRYLDRYTPRQARRHEVKPGVTGWAQVNGRNALSWEEKLEADVWYVDHRSLWLDVEILLKTIVKVLVREGISGKGHATMPEFMGREAVRPSEASA